MDTSFSKDEEKLWVRLEGLELDDPGAPLTFSARLARENGWSEEYTRRVITEYKKFVFLGAVSGHPVTPSEEVDQAWHLHLVYTQSYWHELCREILGHPFHHGPTRGGQAEQSKFHDWYDTTRASYRRFFVEPPEDIWPPPAKRFANASRFRRVNTARHWVIRKPEWPMIRRGAGTSVLLLAAAGCTSYFANLAPFSWRGGPFLQFYLFSGLFLFTAAIVVRRSLRGPSVWQLERDEPLADPYQLAYLAGEGRLHAVNAAVAQLAALEVIQVTGKRGEVSLIAPVPSGLHPFEMALVNTLSRRPMTLRALRASMGSVVDRDERVLRDTGWLLRGGERWISWLLPVSLGAIVTVIGIMKIMVGLSRDKPVGFLVGLTVAAVAGTLFFLVVRPRRSRKGDEAFRLARSHHSRLMGANLGSKPEMTALAVGLFGAGVLQGTALGSLSSRLEPHGGAGGSGGDGGCGSGCGGGGCGGGCGGCGS